MTARERRLTRSDWWIREARKVMGTLLAMERPYVSAATGYTLRRLLRLAAENFGPLPIKQPVTKRARPGRKSMRGPVHAPRRISRRSR